MRRILVENARRKKSVKHGGGRRRVGLLEVELAVEAPGIDLVALDEALTKLAESHPQHVELVKLRYFAGLTSQQAADALAISINTADRYWAYARSWLRLELQPIGERDA